MQTQKKWVDLSATIESFAASGRQASEITIDMDIAKHAFGAREGIALLEPSAIKQASIAHTVAETA